MTIINNEEQDSPVAQAKRFEPLTSSTMPKTFIPEKTFAISRRDLPANASGSVNVEYVNYTNNMVYVKTQAGVIMAIPPQSDITTSKRQDKHLEIRLTTTVNRPEAVRVTTNVLRAHREEQKTFPMTQDASIYLDGLLGEQMREGDVRGVSAYAQTNLIFLTLNQMTKNDAVYIREADALISLHGSIARVQHPNSSIGMAALDVGRLQPSPGQVGIVVKAIDNEGYAGRRFMFSGKDVITIPTYEDPNMESGVYITTMNSDLHGEIRRTTVRYSFEDAEQHGIYRTKEQAITNGNPEKKLENDALQLKSDNISRKIEESSTTHELRMMEKKWDAFMTAMQQQTKEQDRLREERNALLADELREKQLLLDRIRQLEREALETKSLSRKDYYDHIAQERDDYYDRRTAVRKDSSEMLKYIPPFVMGLVGAMAIINYRSSDKLYLA